MKRLFPLFAFLPFLVMGCVSSDRPDSDSGGSASSGSSNGSGNEYILADLSGAWVGSFTPFSSTEFGERGAYLRLDEFGRLLEVADTEAFEWTTATARLDQSINSDGAFMISMSDLDSEKVLIQTLTGVMDSTRTVLQGTYTLQTSEDSASGGVFSFIRSYPGAFSNESHLNGRWSGPAFNKLDAQVSMEIELDSMGSVLSGHVRYGEKRDYGIAHGFLTDSSNEFAVVFTDDEVGRIDDVVLVGTDGSITTFRYLLVSSDGRILGGPGHDSLLGAGQARLSRNL
ncbi:MAG: hypothetical protein HOM34_08035 [Planctomycetes bacterium]|jgi:hypothetical protein|nr:hypothetical protein [Planctomycetota bacterium]MBT5100728.1 hypothetical protein [Planctomycetota bacterium]MBT5120653.1 hypothetical protein [Planctomycetota bacterium]MBT7011989.1 hypothetical protein [Planctomycetota bacterium]MBT7319603.1 hypothetical protein [Planctomycetota bacterium]